MSSVVGPGNISTSDDLIHHIRGFIRVYRDGRCERLFGTQTAPAGTCPLTGVRSKDVVISTETNVSVRLYLPPNQNQKLPLLIFYHGGGFIVDSAFSSTYQPTLNLLTAECRVIVASVDYRLAPEYPIPTLYNDSWEATKWVAAHGSGGGPEPWLNEGADFQKVFLAGDSAGANIAHNMAIRVGLEPIDAIKVEGLILLHPFFGGKDPIGSERRGKHKELKVFTDSFWKLAGGDVDDPLFNPEKDPNLSGLGCSRILVCVAGIDSLRDRGLQYVELVGKSGWVGQLEMMETKGERHTFFLFDTSSHNACTLRKRVCTFIHKTHSRARL